MKFHTFWLTLFSTALLSAQELTYDVTFEGLHDLGTIKAIKKASELTTLKRRPPSSINALRYRAEGDIPAMKKILRANGYFEAQIDIEIEEIFHKVEVTVQIHPGPQYHIDHYTIHLFDGDPEISVHCKKVKRKALGIGKGDVAEFSRMTDAELKLLRLLATCGYPLARIQKREIIADGETKKVRVELNVDTGPPCAFGPAEARGLHKVKPLFISQRIAWKENDSYTTVDVEKTQKALIDSGLFNSVLITHAEKTEDSSELPMQIEVSENKFSSLNLGASYQTFYGFGITFGWENRNIDGLGRKLSLQGELTKRSHSGIAAYNMPNAFGVVGQDFVTQLQAKRENITAYVERDYSASFRLEKKITRYFRASVGMRGERLFVEDSVQNGQFSLLELPLYMRWSTANNLLNPTKGLTLEYTVIPSFDLNRSDAYYVSQQFVFSSYHALGTPVLVLAQKTTLASIIASKLSSIPIPKRVLGGSEEELRGYKYRTVSPLISGQPEGGRGAIYWTLEMRLRLTESIGIVPFFDIGNVELEEYPTYKGQWRKSVGLGLRYFTFMGPFRVDIGYPLNRRGAIDPHYRVLVSIGQMF